MEKAKGYFAEIGLRITLGNLSKNQKKRDAMKADVKGAKQSTLDNLYFQFDIQTKKDKPQSSKAIIISDLVTQTKQDELIVKTSFDLVPSKTSFSKVTLDLYFEEHLLNSALLSIPQSSLLNDSFEFSQVLDMKGMAAGDYLVWVEMYELWSTGEKLSFASKQVNVPYVPLTRESRLVKIPSVKKVAGTDLTVVLPDQKNIYRDIAEESKKESTSKRDKY